MTDKPFDPAHARANGYTRADWDGVDSPPLTNAEREMMRPFTEALPEVATAMRRGRPKSDNPKIPVSIRLSPEVVAHFKAGGKGWQTRIDDALRRIVERS
ncbi:MAG: BrnA antitoxin family protein [Paracoccaceae bacterium]